MDGSSLTFATPEWVYYVLPGGLLALVALTWLGATVGARAAQVWAERGERITLRAGAGTRTLKLALAAGAWSLLCIGLARPQWGTTVQRLPKGGTDLTILVDVSNSMLVPDMGAGATRLEWAKRKIEDLLDEVEREGGHRVGLVPFAGEPFPLVPPTPDYEAARFFLDDLNPSSVAFGGSDVARAVDSSATTLAKLPGRLKALLVISDGDAIEPQASGAVRAARGAAREKAVEAARDAGLKGVRVFALGVGGKESREVVSEGDDGGTSFVRYEDDSGESRIATSALEESTLAELARAGGGEYVHSTLNESDLALLIHSGLLSGGVSGEEETERVIPIERMRWPLLAALVLLLVEMLLPAGGRRTG
ncbi:MAG: vWA domain-containing protein [Planctomycetota bacterium]|jgi:Ca-activated chloride channel family protein